MAHVGSEVRLAASHSTARVTRVLGEGGQGSVFEAVTDDGRHVALKWYHPRIATPSQYEAITRLVDRGAPNDRFLWPLDLAHEPKKEGFGYVMPLRPPEHVGLAALVTGKVDVSLRTLCHIGMQLADSYLRLHSQGLCYRDISFGNVFFDPATGDTLICDNDNVGIDGDTSSPVMGTKTFMAPEIVRRDSYPSIDSDLYSLSVLLFYLLMVGHPLLGRRELEYPVWNEVAESEMFGMRPVFVFDPDNDTNRPAAGIHDAMSANWAIYPRSLRALFERAFTVGLRDPRNGRVRESQWRAELARCGDLLRSCTACGTLNFFDRERPGATCWHCKRVLSAPLVLQFTTGPVVLNELTVITGHHLGTTPYDFSHVVGRIAPHPDRPNVWGLTNTGSSSWRVRLPDGGERQVDVGRSIGLIPRSTVDFGGPVAHLVVAGS